jgi:hypothetical protein
MKDRVPPAIRLIRVSLQIIWRIWRMVAATITGTRSLSTNRRNGWTRTLRYRSSLSHSLLNLWYPPNFSGVANGEACTIASRRWNR